MHMERIFVMLCVYVCMVHCMQVLEHMFVYDYVYIYLYTYIYSCKSTIYARFVNDCFIITKFEEKMEPPQANTLPRCTYRKKQ